MAEALPWMLSTGAILAVLLMSVLDGCKARRVTPSRAAARARLHRNKARAEAETKLDRIAGALESSNAEELLAAEVDDLGAK
jgi:hypothetical protein